MAWHPRKSVVVPIDFSETSPQALSTAFDMVADRADVHLCHVLVPLNVVSPGVAFGEVTDESREQHVRTHAQNYLKVNHAEGGDFQVRFGHPAEEIVEFANEVNADLIVLPSHGYHGLKRFVLGSTAEQVIRHAECAVLVLRRTDAE